MERDEICRGKPGRRRDDSIDARILSAARRQLASRGYEAMSLSSVAEEACTTRQALYRRWHDKQTLVAEAICEREQRAALCVSDDPRADLERELDAFQTQMSQPQQRSLAGTMLQDATDEQSRAEYGRQVIGPRIERIRVILDHARDLGLIDQSADIDVAVTLPMGSLYELQLAGMTTPDDWSRRTAALMWRALGG
jgi:AcrR family transcriptional regulator